MLTVEIMRLFHFLIFNNKKTLTPKTCTTTNLIDSVIRMVVLASYMSSIKNFLDMEGIDKKKKLVFLYAISWLAKQPSQIFEKN